ncbi:MAG: sugar ABC transporter permease [Litorilinea sp.]|nr:MAG: sugar ABC transporter permease [Litorilinea sp.]
MRKFLKQSEATIVIGSILIFVLFSVINTGGWLNFFTIRNITRFTAILGLVAMAETLVILVREIDLSVGAVYGLVGVAFVSLEPTLGVPLAFVAALLLAAVIGWLNATLVLRGKLSSMIVTLGGLFFYRGVIYVTTGGTVRSFDAAARQHWLVQLLGANWLWGLENGFWWFLLLILALSYILFRTPLGNQLFATGGDPLSAASRGVEVDQIKMLAFIGCSVLAGFAGLITLANDPRTNVSIGQDVELEAIAAAVIGGVSLGGGKGSFLGAALGAFFLTSIRSQLIMMGAPSVWYTSFVGAVLVLAAVVNTTLLRRMLRS